MRAALGLALLLALGGPARAQGEPLLMGEARTGADTRPARFTFTCSANARHATGVLGVAVALPHHDTLRAVFEFNSFEGPDANAGRLTRLESRVQGRVENARFAVSGSLGVEDDRPFVFGLYAARRGDAARLADLSRILRPLTQGAGRLVWTQNNIPRAGIPITMTLDIGAAEATVLRGLLRPCLEPG